MVEDLQKYYPKQYDKGFNKGQEYYHSCVPRESLHRGSKFKVSEERKAYGVGVLDGYDQAEKDDYTTKEIT